MHSLRGSVAIVTGATQGIGRAVALQLAAEGVRVVAAARTAEALDRLVAEIQAAGGEAAPKAVDLRDRNQCSNLVEWTVREMGALHILVNNAGLGYWATVEETTDDQWVETMDLNLNAPFYLTRKALGPMKDAGWGHVVNISSGFGMRGVPSLAAYCASKAALILFSEALAREMKPHHLRVSVVSPGAVDTPFRDRQTNRSPEDRQAMLRAEDVASAVVWTLKPSHHAGMIHVSMRHKE